MKKLIFSFAAFILVSIGLISWKTIDPATVYIDEFSCGMFDGDGGFVITDNNHAVVTSNGNGEFRCQAQVPNSTGKAVQYNDFPCGTPAGLTFDGREVVSASGRATLTCNVNNSQ